jgi:hypothetical protein
MHRAGKSISSLRMNIAVYFPVESMDVVIASNRQYKTMQIEGGTACESR